MYQHIFVFINAFTGSRWPTGSHISCLISYSVQPLTAFVWIFFCGYKLFVQQCCGNNTLNFSTLANCLICCDGLFVLHSHECTPVHV